MNTHQFLFSASVLQLLVTLFYSTTTTSAQLSPVHPPISSPPSPTSAQTPGFNTIPLVPISPNTSPSPIIPKTPSIDILQILTKARRFSILIRLLKTTQLINQLNSQLITSSSSTSNGLTLFAPEDSSFIKLKAGFLNSLSGKNKVELLQFHTLSSFLTLSNFDTLTNPVQTQAGDGKRLQLNVTTYGGNHVSLATGAVNATVTGTVYVDNKLAIYEVDKVLLPLDLVLPSKALAPSPVSKPKRDDNTTKSSSSDDGDDSDDDGGSKDLPSESSAAVEGMWQLVLVVGVALLGEAIVLS